MKHMHTVTIPAKTREEESHRTCDICKERIREASGYAVDEVEVSRCKGQRYPEDSYVKKTYFDLCGKCFEEKLVPALKALGAEPSEGGEYD